MVTRIMVIGFSPTGTTKRVLLAIAGGIGADEVKYHDITTPASRAEPICMGSYDAVVVGVPVYEETLPELAVAALRRITGLGKPAVLIAVYGSIGYGVALKRIRVLAAEVGFTPVAAAAFVGEHSFSSAEIAVAAGRPDAEDLRQAAAFGHAVRQKLDTCSQDNSLPELPGRLPLMARILPKGSARVFTYRPDAGAACNRCGACAKLCPAGAIDTETFQINEAACLRCFCCVKRCPMHARHIRYRLKPLVRRMLTKQGGKRIEPEVFF